MSRKTVKDFPAEVWPLFDSYVHGRSSRRDFLDKAAALALGGLTAAELLDALSPRFAEAQVVAPADPRIHTRYVGFDSPQGYGKGRGYLVHPAQVTGKMASILVVHENRGLNPHIEDIARRLALDGFIAFAPDALFPLGGYPGDEDKARELFAKLDQDKTHQDFLAAYAFLKAVPDVNGRLGAVGFCYGGGMVNYLATKLPDLAAAVPFYGTQPPADEVPNIKARLLIHYAGADDRINAGWPAYESALKAAHVRYQAFIYEGAQHGFNNDTTPRYDEAAAKLAWKRTVDFFKATLGS
jgi:carboxymethylenebutenolidase